MSKKRQWSASQKFEIALLAIKNETTINDICKKYEIAPTQVYEWKKQLLEQGANLFDRNGRSSKVLTTEHEKEKNKLFAKVGELTMERDFLKKSLAKLPPTLDKD